MALQEVDVSALAPERLHSLIGPDRARRFDETAAAARAALAGRTVLNVNSTATGGGVAELLQTLLAYGRGAGVNARWVVIEGDPRFFEITKRVHNHLYGTTGDGGPLGPAEHADYDETIRNNTSDVVDLVRPGDIVILHDPQTAGLVGAVMRAGAHVVWRCHVGVDTRTRNPTTHGNSCGRTSKASTATCFRANSSRRVGCHERVSVSSRRPSIPSRRRTKRWIPPR